MIVVIFRVEVVTSADVLVLRQSLCLLVGIRHEVRVCTFLKDVENLPIAISSHFSGAGTLRYQAFQCILLFQREYAAARAVSFGCVSDYTCHFFQIVQHDVVDLCGTLVYLFEIPFQTTAAQRQVMGALCRVLIRDIAALMGGDQPEAVEYGVTVSVS